MAQNILEKLSPAQSDISKRIYELVLGRVLKRVYLGLGDNSKKEMEKVFLSNEDNLKEQFLKDNISDFESVFKEELEKINQEILEELKNQI